jgi:hypothetical protein
MVSAQAIVMESVAGIEHQDVHGAVEVRNAVGILPWKARARMLVLVSGEAPMQVSPNLRMSSKKYAVAGTILPVTLDPGLPESVDVGWDDVPPLDDWVAAGAEVFTNPDAAWTRLNDAQRAFAGVGLAPPDSGTTLVPGEPTARVIASSPGQIRFELLLSVAIPGQARYGLRWRGHVPGGRYLPEWGDIPVRVDKKDRIEILWDQVSSAWAHATDRADAAGARLEGMLAAGAALPAWTPGAPLAAPPAAVAPPASPAADPATALRKLAALHASGVLTDEELAAERARVLAQI